MTIQTEIRNKEKLLAELMVKILEVPLDPINTSIKMMQSDLLDTQEQLQSIYDLVAPSLTALVEDGDKANKHARKVFTKIQEDIPALKSQLQEHMVMVSEGQRQALESVIVEHAVQSNESLEAASENFFKALSRTTSTQSETLLTILSVRQELIIAIEDLKASQTLDMQVALKEIRSAQNFREKNSASLALKLETVSKDVATRLEALSTEMRDALTEQRQNKQEVSEILGSNHAETCKLLTQQHAALQEKVTMFQHKLKNQMITIGVFFVSMLAYIGFDILRILN